MRDTVGPGGDVLPDAAMCEAARRYAGWLETGADLGPGTPAGSAVPPEVLQAARTTRSVDVFLPVPDVPRVLLLSFSTPMTPLSGPLTTLFLTIASTVQWQHDGGHWS